VSAAPLLVEVADGVARLTLNRPEVRNALDAALLSGLEAALARLEDDADARVIVLRGAGDRAFCAGADLRRVGDCGSTRQARESFSGLARILERLARMRTPVIRAVGRKRVMLMILSGEPVSAPEALEMGLVSSRVVPRALLETTVDTLARTLAGYSPTALGLAKEAAATPPDLEYGAALRYLRELLTLVALSDDAREGIAAFFEKRAPRFTGR
jgi:enoyl-CoA hydratase/carnithine racemase